MNEMYLALECQWGHNKGTWGVLLRREGHIDKPLFEGLTEEEANTFCLMKNGTDWRDVLTNYIGMIIEIEGYHYIENLNRTDGFTDEQWGALCEAAKEHPNGVL